MRGRLPHVGDVPPARRDRRLRQAGVHRLQGVHRRLPVRRDLHQPRGPLGREVQLLRAPARRRASSRPAWWCARPRRSSSATWTTRTPKSARIVDREPVAVRRPEKETRPKLFYKGATQATLDPLAARRPDGGIVHVERACPPAPQQVTSGHPGRCATARGRRVAVLRRPAPDAVGLAGQPVHLDQGHRGRRLPGGAAAGADGGRRLDRSARGAGPRRCSAAASSAATGGLLIWDLEHPGRSSTSSRARSGGAGWCGAGSSSPGTARCSGCTCSPAP